MRRPSKLDRLAQILYTDITWSTASHVDDIYPGFLSAFEKAQDEWEKDPNNRTFEHFTHPISKRLANKTQK